ncbi:FadR/GntR family transcriptional regulator [Micromonospora sp. NPDC048868]|uniref:FadR/GntR family transcriptional regulator n=1 Tax=Micromonospora sp. NPDC048868 TaxID=3364258 RepID=UPI00371A3E85
MLGQVADGVLVHESEFLQSNTIVVQGRAGVLLIDPGLQRTTACLAILDDLVATRRVLESDMANVAARLADAETIDRLRALVDRMDELVDDHVTYHEHDRAFHDTVMQASGNRIARGVVQALESQVINTARYMGRTERSLCVASNRGHRRIYERIAAHDPDGAAEAMFTPTSP